MLDVDYKLLFNAGVHIGHKSFLCHPSMKQYVLKKVNKINIIDLCSTVLAIKLAHNDLIKLLESKKTILFVCTKKKICDSIKKLDFIKNHFYILHKWIGGLLTNWNSIKELIKHYKDLKKYFINNCNINKKELISKKKKFDKLKLLLEGIENMNNIPDAVFIVDVNKEKNAVLESHKMGIKIYGIVDTDSNTKFIDFVIPGNDDSLKSITSILNLLFSVGIKGK